MWFTRFIWQGPLTPQTHQKNNKIKRKKQKQTNKKKTLPPAHPLCYATNTITWWQTKKTSSAYTTNTTGKCDAPPTSTALPSPQRCPLNKGGEMIWKNRIDWLMSCPKLKQFQLQCDGTKDKKRERSVSPSRSTDHLWPMCFSDYLWPTSTQRSAATTLTTLFFPPSGEMTNIFLWFCFKYT